MPARPSVCAPGVGQRLGPQCALRKWGSGQRRVDQKSNQYRAGGTSYSRGAGTEPCRHGPAPSHLPCPPLPLSSPLLSIIPAQSPLPAPLVALGFIQPGIPVSCNSDPVPLAPPRPHVTGPAAARTTGIAPSLQAPRDRASVGQSRLGRWAPGPFLSLGTCPRSTPDALTRLRSLLHGADHYQTLCVCVSVRVLLSPPWSTAHCTQESKDLVEQVSSDPSFPGSTDSSI